MINGATLYEVFVGVRLFSKVTSSSRVTVQDFTYYLSYSKIYSNYYHIVYIMLKQGGSILLLFCILIEYGSGLYFHIGETERKCFLEEIPDETKVLVHYKVELYDPRSDGFMPSSPGIGMHVEVRDPDDTPILSRVYSSEGRIAFTSHTPGEHVICLYSNSTAWFSGVQLRVHLDIQVGEQAIDYANVAQKEKLSELQLRIRQLVDQVEQITKEQNYQRYREERFRQTSESTHRRVVWWSLSQTVILLIMVCITGSLNLVRYLSTMTYADGYQL